MDAHVLEILRADDNVGYGRLPIPARRDEQICQIVQSWAALSATARENASKQFDREEYWNTLECYSLRMASFAVRLSSAEPCYLGLLALGIPGFVRGWRIDLTRLSCHVDALRRIRTDPKTVFERASQLLPANAAAELRLFLERPPRLQRIEAMYYAAIDGPDGFRYQQDL